MQKVITNHLNFYIKKLRKTCSYWSYVVGNFEVDSEVRNEIIFISIMSAFVTCIIIIFLPLIARFV